MLETEHFTLYTINFETSIVYNAHTTVRYNSYFYINAGVFAIYRTSLGLRSSV
jgi:hypothetical protein